MEEITVDQNKLMSREDMGQLMGLLSLFERTKKSTGHEHIFWSTGGEDTQPEIEFACACGERVKLRSSLALSFREPVTEG